MIDEFIATLALVTVLCLVLGLAGYFAEKSIKRSGRFNDDGLPPPDINCERDGSIESFYRQSETLDHHRRRWRA